MRVLSQLVDAIKFGLAARDFDAMMWGTVLIIALLTLAAALLVRGGGSTARSFVTLVALAKLAAPIIVGGMLSYWGAKLYFSNSTIERASKHVRARVAATKGGAVDHQLGLMLVHVMEFEGHFRVYREAGSNLRGKIKVGDDLSLWYRDNSSDGTITVVQADINGKRVLTWKRPFLIPIAMMLMGLGLIGVAAIALRMVTSPKRNVTVSHNLELVEGCAEGPTTIQTFLGAWRHTNGPLDQELIISEDGTVIGTFETSRSLMQFRAKLTIKPNGLGVAKGNCDLYVNGELRGTLRVRFRLRKKENSLHGSLRIAPVNEAASESKLGFRLSASTSGHSRS